MACCGRGRNSNSNHHQNSHYQKQIKSQVPFKVPKVPRVSVKTCTKCKGTLQPNPNKVLIGNQMLTKNKCTQCGSIYYFL